MKKSLAIVLCALLLVSLGSSLAFAQEDAPVYVVLGDSIARGEQGTKDQETESYAAIVAKENGYELRNHAVNGYNSKQLKSQLKKKKVQDDIRAADIISLSIGANDFLTNINIGTIILKASQGDYSMVDDTIEKLTVNFDSIITKLCELNSDALILMQTLYNPMYNEQREMFGVAVQKLNAMFTQYLEEHPGAYVLVETGKALEGEQAYIHTDGIHPNVAGHAKIAEVILEEIALQTTQPDTAQTTESDTETPIPQTGGDSTAVLWAFLASAALAACSILLKKRKISA